MNLIMNERKEAEKIIESGDINFDTGAKLSLLARYYASIDKKPKEIKTLLQEIMVKKYNNYHPDDWELALQKYVNKAKKYPIVEIDEIPITKNEMRTISQINNKKLEKLAFVLLVLAKFCNMRNENNNNWVMVDEYSVFLRARITGNTIAQYSCFYKLAKMDLITYSKKVDNINVRVGFIDNDSEIALKVTDLRELGYQYLMYKGEKFIKCAECGIVTRATIHNKKYCKNCAGYQPIVTKTIKCCDCGEYFEVDARITNKIRCDNCQLNINREKKRQWKKHHDSNK